MVPADVLQKAGGPGWTVWVGVVGREPLSPWPPDALQDRSGIGRGWLGLGGSEKVVWGQQTR